MLRCESIMEVGAVIVVMAKSSISMPDDLYDRVEERLGPSLSKWMQRAARRSMYIEDRSDEFGGKLPDEWWQDALDEYIERRTVPAQDHTEAEAD